eukprot:scaffold186904_cov19-Tisochrysis_lutea.AAC.1
MTTGDNHSQAHEHDCKLSPDTISPVQESWRRCCKRMTVNGEPCLRLWWYGSGGGQRAPRHGTGELEMCVCVCPLERGGLELQRTTKDVGGWHGRESRGALPDKERDVKYLYHSWCSCHLCRESNVLAAQAGAVSAVCSMLERQGVISAPVLMTHRFRGLTGGAARWHGISWTNII